MVLLAAIALCLACGTADEELPEPPAEYRACLEADALRRLGDPEGALVLAEEALAADPGSIPFHRLIQDALRDLGREEEMRTRYRALQGQQPTEPRYEYLLGRALLPDVEASRPLFEECAARDPGFGWCTVALARLEVLAGDRFGALELHREAIEAGYGSVEIHASAGFLYLDLRLLRDAERSFQEVLDEDPWDTTAMGGLGQVKGLLGRDREASALLERALAIDASRTDLLGTLAFVRYQAGDLEGAWDAATLQQEIDGSADPLLVWKLARELERDVPHTVVLGPYYLSGGRQEATP